MMDNKKGVILKPKQTLSPSQSQLNGKRKTWKSETSPIQLTKQTSDLDEQPKEMIKKTRSGAAASKELTIQTMNVKSPIQLRKVKSEANKTLKDDGNEKHPVLRKAKSELNKSGDESSDEKDQNSLQLVMVKSVSNKVLDENGKSSKALNDDDVNEKHPVLRKAKSKPNNESFDGNVKNSLQLVRVDSVPSKEFDEKSKVLDKSNKNLESVVADIQVENLKDSDVCEEKEIEVEIKKKSVIVKEISIAEKKSNNIAIEEKKDDLSNEKSVPVKKKLHPVVNNVGKSKSKSKAIPVSEEYQTSPRRHGKLQSLVDLVMWNDVSKSAFIFGIGTFIIISSSFSKDINISLISVFSYLGLVYLAVTFLFRSLIPRGASADMCKANRDHVIGEEEVVWLMNMIVPYINEFLLNVKALFSGDPATTMKMAVLLYVLARCGSSITIWKMAKLGFFGVFILPKVCSSYCTQITAFGTFWIRRFGDAWESCSHKKAVAFGVFALVWNLSSIFARIWGVFMLFVAFKYYQQMMIKEGWTGTGTEARAEDNSWQGQTERHRKDRRKLKKPF